MNMSQCYGIPLQNCFWNPRTNACDDFNFNSEEGAEEEAEENNNESETNRNSVSPTCAMFSCPLGFLQRPFMFSIISFCLNTLFICSK